MTNYFDVQSRVEYWISGPRRDGQDRLYKSNIPVEIDEDVREESGLRLGNSQNLKQDPELKVRHPDAAGWI